MDSSPKLTDTIAAARTGDKVAAAELMPLLYRELRQLGQAMLRHQPPGHTLQATALVHEAYAKVVGTVDQGWDGRARFGKDKAIAIAAGAKVNAIKVVIAGVLQENWSL